MKCPSCGVESAEGAAECPACGLIFAKWQKKAEAPAQPAAAPETDPAPAASGGGPGSWLVGLVLLAATAGGAAYYFLQPAGAKDGPKLISPEPYRAEIAALESALYKDEPANYQDAAAVEESARRLEAKLAGPRRLRAHGSLEKINMLAAMAGEGGLTYTSTARRDWITRWEDARSGLFEKAEWFHAPVFFDPGAAAAADPAKAAIDLRRVLGWTDRLIAEARAEISVFPKHDINLQNLKADPGNEAQLEQWRAWAQGWQARVSEAAAALPPPQNLSEEQREAHRAMKQVLDLLAVPANPGAGVFLGLGDPAFSALYLPGESLRDNWLNTADNWLKYPRSLLDKTPRQP